MVREEEKGAIVCSILCISHTCIALGYLESLSDERSTNSTLPMLAYLDHSDQMHYQNPVLHRASKWPHGNACPLGAKPE
jgi:hypothetical protein